MPFRKRDEPVADDIPEPDAASPATALSLAEAEAAAAEAEAKAAAARVQALRLREQTAAVAGPDPATVDTVTVSLDKEPDDSTAVAATADAADADTEIVDAATSVPSDHRPRNLWQPLRWVAGTLVVLAIAALVTASVLMVRNHQQISADQQRAAEYIAAGRQGVVTLMSLNFNSIDEDVQRILDNSTGEFRKDFEDKAKDFSQVAKESQVITEASSTAAGLESMTDNEAVVLVAASTKVTNKAGARQEPRSWRLAIHLIREDGQIKMSKVDFAP